MLVFDNRNFGASDGQPRQKIDPWAQVRLPGGHFDAYVQGFDAASGPARDWFAQHLAG